MTRRLYVSDVHLDPDDHQRLRAFRQLLLNSRDAVDEIYVLGDLCEMWIGDDDDSKLVGELTELFSTLSAVVSLSFVPGNRDFLLGKAFAERTGLSLLPDPVLLPDGTLLAHGDALCTDDAPYQQMRALLRSSDWQTDILNKTLAERRAFGANLREQSKQANANKSSNIMDVNADAVAELLTEHKTNLLIHGHTHRPGIHAQTSSARRVVLGAWEVCGWWAIQEDAAVTLHCQSIEQLAAS